MRNDLLKSIEAAKDITNAIILTHNIDFVFLQTVVLAAFRKCGHPTITVFADAQCAAESFAHQRIVLDGLGFRYRVVPVAMRSGFRFHPKAVLLSGESDATLFVGSGNLTFGGWRENAEVWMRFDAAADGPTVFEEFNKYMREVLERVPLSDPIEEELAEAFDSETRRWASDEQVATSPTLLGRAGSGKALLASFKDVQGAELIDELVVCSPYFDAEGSALRALIEQTAASRNTILYQPSGSNLTRRAFEAAGSSANLQRVSFEHISVDSEARSAFIHAKFYALLFGDRALVIAGSANCSRAALSTSESSGNAELMAIRHMPRAEFESSLIGEIQQDSEPVALAEAAHDPDDQPVTTILRVLAARFESGILHIGFAPSYVEISSCEVDGAKIQFSHAEVGVVSAVCAVEPRFVRLEGLLDGVVAMSALAWVDHERYLRSSSRSRRVADSIRARMQHGKWTAAAWAEVMDVFCKHLTYMPTRDRGRAASTTLDTTESKGAEFSYADVFSSGYEVPILSGLEELVVKLEGGKERSLQQLLLRWFGVEGEVPDIPDISPNTGDDDDDEVDRIEVLQPSHKPPVPLPLTDADKRRIQRILQQVTDSMTVAQFLGERRPELIAADLKVASALLRTGLREGWIDAHEFFQATNRIWGALFFSGSPEESQGWIEYRMLHAEDPTAFVAAVRSPELAAALLGWAFAVVPERPSLASAQFQLVVALAVARLPWLWDTGDEAAVARELEVLLAHTGTCGAISAARVRAAWTQMLRRGHALLRLEAAANAFPPSVLRARIQASELVAGDLLWQGRAGYCVVRKSTPRTEGKTVPVLKLQQQSEESIFMAPFTMPVGSLLLEQVIPLSYEFNAEPRRVLHEFLDELKNCLIADPSAVPVPKISPAGAP
ncbi:hypothetical protein [Burkholderia ambifaria]|uniref:hypothetical protein n=1 Tax=Burkholderia ambifaria TaxID=152480 RepID=UPI001589C95E|nr:hypothetical protein [Burkholderia ambifaria]